MEDAEERSTSEDICELRRSHAQLTLQVATLGSDLRNSLSLFHSERLVIYNHLREKEDNRVNRIVQFAKQRAKKVLLGPSSELSKTPSTICTSNSVVHTLLRSSASDCTLFEFQLFASKTLSDRSIQCRALPSEYHLQFPNINRTTRLHIVFETYADLCQALKLDAVTRETAVYREKKSRAQKAISSQILGVEVLNDQERRILLGCNFPTRESTSQITYLHQESRAWFEGTWECGFSLKSSSASEIYDLMDRGVTPMTGRGTNRYSDPPHTFSISWERTESDNELGTRIIITGALRSAFPAIVLRTQVLTSSARNLITSPIDGRSLKQRLSNPTN